MASLSTYTDLQGAIADFLQRGDCAAEIPAYFITLAEAMLNKAVRSTRMVADAPVQVAAGAFNGPLPSDCLETVYVAGATPQSPLRHVSGDKIADLRLYRFVRPGTPRFYAVVGRSLEVCPAPIAALSVDLRYYQQIPPLAASVTGSNWLLASQPDLYLYASLFHALPFLRDDDRVSVQGNLLTQLISSALANNARITLEDNQPPALSFAAGAQG